MGVLRVLGGVIYAALIFAAIVLLPGRAWYWPRAWIFLVLTVVGTLATSIVLQVRSPGLLKERWGAPVQRGQPVRDRILVLLLVAGFCGSLAFASWDGHQRRLLPPPSLAVALAGLIVAALGWTLMSAAMLQNAFAAPVVKLQPERGQHVIDTGVYSLVRHPMYSGAALFMLGTAVWLGSWAGAIATLVPDVVMALRIVSEERFLAQGLPGYTAYRARVRWRLIPFVW
jgi:protein-S-isoprenylcysteine O-methyltransferase Ste14